jgi:hypothetical protein
MKKRHEDIFLRLSSPKGKENGEESRDNCHWSDFMILQIHSFILEVAGNALDELSVDYTQISESIQFIRSYTPYFKFYKVACGCVSIAHDTQNQQNYRTKHSLSYLGG